MGSLVSLDIETRCGVGCKEKCEHALDSFRNEVSVVGLVWGGDSGGGSMVCRDTALLRPRLDSLSGGGVVGHNLKFDLRTLACKGIDLTDMWEDDTLLMAATLTEKVDPAYLAEYEQERKHRNEKLPRGFSHRAASPHSLKVLAPYFLGVEPFWEDPTNHDNDEYVLKDCQYTLGLADVLSRKLREEGSYSFYKERLLPWTKLLLRAELRGISLDLPAMEQCDREAKATADDARARLDLLWADAHSEYQDKLIAEVRKRYAAMETKAMVKAKDKGKVVVRYGRLCDEAISKVPEKLNLDSPAQLSWLLKDYLHLDIKDFDGEETTGKAVLSRLAGEGRQDISEFLRYRKSRKLTQAFFPKYRELQVEGAIHCSFNPTGTRTGRLSSSQPNLQQVERGIHHLFRARAGYKLATYDMSAIEPRLIAYYTSDLNLFDIVATGKDFHNYNTAQFFDLDPTEEGFKKKYAKQREVGKEVGLAIMYGAGTTRLRESAQKRGFVWSQKEAQYKLERFKEFYEGVYRFREDIINPALLQGRVTNLLGRQFAIECADDIHMTGLNTLIQSSASDLVIESARRIEERCHERDIDAHVLLLVHDEIVTEIPESREAECVEIIKGAMTRYPLRCELGPVPLAVEGAVSETWSK